MSVASVFEFRFSPDSTEEGVELARDIGADMPATEGYLAHNVIRDVADAGHVVVITHWSKQSEAVAVLSE